MCVSMKQSQLENAGLCFHTRLAGMWEKTLFFLGGMSDLARV